MVKFSNQVFDTICQRITEGESVNSICSSKDMPSRQSFYVWMDGNDDLIDKYARAMDARADVLFDDLLKIADTPVIGEKTKIDKEGNEEVTKGDMIEHRRLQVDARKWVLARMSPRKYGDKLDLNHSGALTVKLPDGSQSV